MYEYVITIKMEKEGILMPLEESFLKLLIGGFSVVMGLTTLSLLLLWLQKMVFLILGIRKFSNSGKNK